MLDNKILLENIKKLCDSKGIKITNLEKELGFGGGIISRWGNNADPSLSKIIDIADYFHVTLDEVVGRNQVIEDYENDIIIPLMQMTTNKEIEWEFISDYDSKKIKEQSYDEIFCLFSGDEIEIYKCNFYDSAIFLVAQYDLEQGIIENLDIQIYIQPDSDSLPVIQDINENWIQEFWVGIRKPFKGVPNEWKAEQIRNQITGKVVTNIFGLKDFEEKQQKLSSNSRPNIAHEQNSKILEQLNSPAMQSTIQFLQSDAFKSIQKIMQNEEFLTAIQNTQKIKDNI